MNMMLVKVTLNPGHLHMKIKTCFSKKTTGPFLTKFCILAFRYKEMKIHEHDAGHMTKMATMPIYGKNLSKISRNLWTDFHKTRYVASRTPAHHSLFK